MAKLEHGTEVFLLLAPAEGAERPEPEPWRGAIRLLEPMGHGVSTGFPLGSGPRAPQGTDLTFSACGCPPALGP